MPGDKQKGQEDGKPRARCPRTRGDGGRFSGSVPEGTIALPMYQDTLLFPGSNARLRGAMQGSAPCVLRFGGAKQFLSDAERMLGAPLSVGDHHGAIVNFGAALLHPTKGNKHSNHDDSWELFFSPELRRLQFRMVAFEGSEAAVARNKLEFQRNSSHYYLHDDEKPRVQLVEEFVNPHTIGATLRRLKVPRDFLLLKIDIDSVDLHAFTAVVQAGFRPLLVWVERSDAFDPFRFAALAPAPSEPPMRPKAQSWHAVLRGAVYCSGATTNIWRTHGRRLGFDVLRSDKKNLLLIPTRHRSQFPASEPGCTSMSNVTNSERTASSQAWTRLRALEAACTEASTPYVLEWGDETCPTSIPVGGYSRPPLSFCRSVTVAP